MWCTNYVGHFQALVCLQVCLQMCLQVSLQLAGRLSFEQGEHLTGLLVDELPEVLEGDVLLSWDLHVLRALLLTLDPHFLQDLIQALLLHHLQTGSRESVGRSQLEPLREHDLRHQTL